MKNQWVDVGHMGLGKTAWNFYKCRKMEHVRFDGHMCVWIYAHKPVCVVKHKVFCTPEGTNALVFR